MEEKNENNEATVANEEKNNGNYISGIIGAILGGLIATIPWILCYVYANMIISILAALIAAGGFYGYKLFNGKITKKLPLMIMILSILIVAITNFVIIPIFLLHDQGFAISLESLKALYRNSEFLSGITKDGLISIAFTILGASVITANIKRKIDMGKTDDIDLSNQEEIEEKKQDSIKKVKPTFEKFNAFEKEHGILKDELMQEIDKDIDLKLAFNYLSSIKVIRKAKGRYYYSVEDESKQTKPVKKVNSKIVSIVIAVILIATMAIVIMQNQSENTKLSTQSDGVVNFEVSQSWEEYSGYVDEGWNYYKYINTVPPLDSETIDENDFSKYPAYLSVSYYDIDLEQMSNIEDVKKSMKEYIESMEHKPEIYEDAISKSSKGYDLIKIKMQFAENPSQIEYAYYLLNGSSMACIDAYSFNLDDSEELEKTVNQITETFEWAE